VGLFYNATKPTWGIIFKNGKETNAISFAKNWLFFMNFLLFLTTRKLQFHNGSALLLTMQYPVSETTAVQ